MYWNSNITFVIKSLIPCLSLYQNTFTNVLSENTPLNAGNLRLRNINFDSNGIFIFQKLNISSSQFKFIKILGVIYVLSPVL